MHQQPESKDKDKGQPRLTDADDPKLFNGVNGKFPIQKLITASKAGEKCDIVLKGVTVRGGAKFLHKIVEPKSKGGGQIQFVVGASRWELALTFEDMELEENKVIIHGV